MPVRVKTRINPKKINDKIIKELHKNFPKREIRNSILNRIATGNSPVQGKGKFAPYSRSYKDSIKGNTSFRTIEGKVIPYRPAFNSDRDKFRGKQIRPVNLKITGKMLKSLKIREIRNGISIIFTDPKAIFHDQEGAGKAGTIRRLLPGKDEKFYRPIQKRINEAFSKAVKKAFGN